MKNIFKNIITIFQFNLKWVRIMMIISILTVLALFTIPSLQKNDKIPVKALREHVMEEYALERADSTIHPLLAKPIEIKIINEEKETPFDWKGTITWAIGAMNGLILIILNIKNILKKK